MKCTLKGEVSNAIFNPLRLFKGIGRDKNAGENVGRAIAGLIDAPIETVFAVTENLLYRVPAGFIRSDLLKSEKEVGYLDIPDRLEAENLLDTVDEDSNLRQTFYDQYSKNYSLYRLDLNITPMLTNEFTGYRIMDMEIMFTIKPSVKCTDVYPQTKWEREGLRVGDRVCLNASGQYTPSFGMGEYAAMEPARGDGQVGYRREYFYDVSYDTLVPTVEGRAMNDGFGIAVDYMEHAHAHFMWPGPFNCLCFLLP